MENLRAFISLVVFCGMLAGPVAVPAAMAHPGGLNAEGCHNQRSNGTYHCHRNPRASQPVDRAQGANGDTYYRNCDAARRAGAAPIYRGQPGYRAALDRDNDGIACEPYRQRR